MEQLLQEKEKKITFLESENTLLHNVIAQVPGHVYWMNKEGTYLGCNNANAQFFGFSSPDGFIGKCHNDFFNPDIAKQLHKVDQGVIASGKEYYVEEESVDTNNHPAIYLTKKTPFTNHEGETIGVIGVSFDISDRKKMEHDLKIAKEKAEASDHAKSQFIAVMNHELNTPLASIIGLVDLLKNGNLPPSEEKNMLSTIKNCTQHLLNLVNQVLDFTRLEKGNSHVDKTFINLSSVIQEVYNLLYITAKNKGLELRVHFNQHINTSIFTDPHILLQILINLVNNAIKFTQKGHVTIQVNVNSQKAQTIMLELAVIDTGIGIPADKLESIFQPFHQLKDAYTRESSRNGTGLGLAIVKKLSEQLNIKINVSSKPGQGSIFSLMGEFKTCDDNTLTTPVLTPSKKTSANKTNIKTSDLTIAAKKLRILLVEDDPVIQYIHRKMLERFQCHIEIVSNGHDAIKTENEYDIVFVDISLPDISGFEVIKTLRNQKPPTLQIIALTVHTGKKEKQACIQAGANKFINKPITQAKLRKILMQV